MRYPSLRPRAVPRITGAVMEYGLPSSSSAVLRSPPATARRTSVDETSRFPTATAPTKSTTNPSFSPSSRRIVSSPDLARPNPWSWPITNSSIWKRSIRRRTKASGEYCESSFVKGRKTTRSSSPWARISSRSSPTVSSRGAAWGFTISSGWGSKVTSTLRLWSRLALRAISLSMAQWPR